VSAWPELMIACDIRGRGEWLAAITASLPIVSLPTHSDYRQTGQTSQPGYILHLSPLQAADAKKTSTITFPDSTTAQSDLTL